MIVVLTIFRMLIFLKIIVQYSCVIYNVKVIYTEEEKKKKQKQKQKNNNNHFIFYSRLPRQ